MSTESTFKATQKYVYECPSTVNIAGNEIRFVRVDDINNCVHFPRNFDANRGRLLFLGCDVLSGTNVLNKNYARTHLRFSKIGIAAKMDLDGFKIKGVHNSSSLWFCSIQGLFHVAFELGNRGFQRDCLLLMKDEWLKGFYEPLLEPFGVLRHETSQYFTSPPPQDTSVPTGPGIFVPQPVGMQAESDQYTGRLNASVTEGEPPVMSSEEMEKIIQVNAHASTSRTSVQERVEPTVDDAEEMAEAESELHEDTVKHIKTEIQEEIMDCTYRTQFQTTKFVKELAMFMHEKDYGYISGENVKRIIIVLDYLNHFELSRAGHYDNVENGLFKIMQEFLFVLGSDSYDKNKGVFQNNFDISKDKFILLHLVSDWLGQEYHDLETQIAGKVDTFKQENIASIDYLPPSEALIDALFPSFMRTFIVNWCGFGQKNEHTSQACEPDAGMSSEHQYGEDQSVSKHTNYPLVQLMLEFGSNSLISGIAHVVFSRLQAQNESETNS